MKKNLQKLLSCLLAFCLLLPVTALTAAALPKTPIVYVRGENAVYATKEDGTRYAPREEFADELIAEVVPALAPDFAKAMLSGDYTEWSAKALEAIEPIYGPVGPNPDGTLPPDTDISWHWSPATLRPTDARYNEYDFWWDPRRAPLDVADDLNEYIQAVKQQNNVDKVVLASCCAGTGEEAAYLTKYGTQDVAKVIFLCNSLHGFGFADLSLSGNVTICGSALYRYLQEYDLLGGLDDGVTTFIMTTLKTLNVDATADEILDLFMNIYDKIGDCFIAPFLRMYLGTSLGDVATVDEHFDDYLEYVFPTEELKAEYAPIIAKATEFHETVQKPLDDMLREINANGVPVYFIANYGEQTYPVGDMSDYVGDQLQSVYMQSYGATTARVPETLSDSYIAAQTEKGLGKYISPDKQIDASTCMFPEQTWFIKNLRHSYENTAIESLIDVIAHTDDVTVDTLEAYPQFLNANESLSAVTPAQAVNANDIDWASLEPPQMNDDGNFIVSIIAFFAKIVAFLNRVIRAIKNLFGAIQ